MADSPGGQPEQVLPNFNFKSLAQGRANSSVLRNTIDNTSLLQKLPLREQASAVKPIPAQIEAWANGWITEKAHVKKEDGTLVDFYDNEDMLRIKLERSHQLRRWCMHDPVPGEEVEVDKKQDRVNMRLLRHLLEVNNPERIDMSVRKGESMISMGMNGLKILNDHLIGYDNTRKLLAHAQASTSQILRKHDLVGLFDLSEQTAFKFLCLKTAIPAQDLPQKLAEAEAEIRSQINSYIDQMDTTSERIDESKKEEVKKQFVVTFGFATAKEDQTDSFELVKRSLMNTQAYDTLKKIVAFERQEDSDTREILEDFFITNHVDLSELDTIEGEKKAVIVAKLGNHLRRKLAGMVGDHFRVSLDCTNDAGEPQLGMSEEFFSYIRKKDIEKLKGHLGTDNTNQAETIMNLGSIYLDCLTAPAMLRYHVSGRRDRLIQQGQRMREAITKLDRYYLEGKVPEPHEKKELFELAQTDRKFGIEEKVFTAPWMFDEIVLSMEKGYHLIGMDLVGVGAAIGLESQRLHAHMDSLNEPKLEDNYNSILYNTRDLGQGAWKRISDTFLATARFMKEKVPAYKEWCDRKYGGRMPVEIRGDEMFLVIPDDLSSDFHLNGEEVQKVIFDLDEYLHQEEDYAEARIAYVKGDEGAEADEDKRISAYIELMKELSMEAPGVAKNFMEQLKLRFKDRIGVLVQLFKLRGTSQRHARIITRNNKNVAASESFHLDDFIDVMPHILNQF